MKNLEVREIIFDETKGYQYGDSGWYEAFTDNRGRLFKSCQKEYGRCISTMYIDNPDDSKAKSIKVGWVFARIEKYEDCDETYNREVWVEVREQQHNNR